MRGHYVKNGLPTFEQNCIRCALRPLLKLYGDDSVDSFGPKALKAVRDEFIRNGQCRQTVNANVGRVRRLFKWAESEELVAAGTHHTLCTVAGLQRGRTTAREADPVEPVSDSMIDAVLPHLTATVADMVRFQRFTGCRPNEVCQLRPCDVDRSGDVWRYIPATHKTEHRNRQRIILIGPRRRRFCCATWPATAKRIAGAGRAAGKNVWRRTYRCLSAVPANLGSGREDEPWQSDRSVSAGHELEVEPAKLPSGNCRDAFSLSR